MPRSSFAWVVWVGSRVVEIQLMGNEQSRARYEVDDNERIGDVARRYLQEHDPSLLNSQYGYTISAVKPDGKMAPIDSNTTVKDLITKHGTDRVAVLPNAVYGAPV